MPAAILPRERATLLMLGRFKANNDGAARA